MIQSAIRNVPRPDKRRSEHPLENPLHIAFLLLILLLVFGAKRLPEMGRSLGSGLRGFKESISGESSPGSTESLAAAAAPRAPAPASAPAPAPAAPAPKTD